MPLSPHFRAPAERQYKTRAKNEHTERCFRYFAATYILMLSFQNSPYRHSVSLDFRRTQRQFRFRWVQLQYVTLYVKSTGTSSDDCRHNGHRLSVYRIENAAIDVGRAYFKIRRGQFHFPFAGIIGVVTIYTVR